MLVDTFFASIRVDRRLGGAEGAPDVAADPARGRRAAGRRRGSRAGGTRGRRTPPRPRTGAPRPRGGGPGRRRCPRVGARPALLLLVRARRPRRRPPARSPPGGGAETRPLPHPARVGGAGPAAPPPRPGA